jgi:hypothetical protein
MFALVAVNTVAVNACKLVLPPTNKLPPTPTPPVTIIAPVVVDVVTKVPVANIPGAVIYPPELARGTPSILIVALVTYRDLNLVDVEPKSYKPFALGNIEPVTVIVLPTFKLPPIPTPPVTVKAPVVVDVDVAEF